MAILKVAQMGHPVLREVAEEVPVDLIPTPGFQSFVDDMIDTMREYDGAGLAAPQVHESLRVVVIESMDNPRYPDADQIPLTVLVNPKLTSFSQEMDEQFEGCLSLDNLVGKVRRATSVKVEALDRSGAPIVIEAEGFMARACQHEIDHLYGKLYVDRMSDMKELYFRPEFIRYGRDEDVAEEA